MEALVITLEGIEAALVVDLILAYLNRTGRTALNCYVYLGLGLASNKICVCTLKANRG
jgi:hypothetical protein